jgi:aryl-alcohol dehydrogenase-like predicted oxidoreductase
MADGLGITPAQLALAWVQAKGQDIVAIPGTKSPRRLEENADAVDVKLSAEDVEALDAALPSGGVAGTRYSASDMEMLSH